MELRIRTGIDAAWQDGVGGDLGAEVRELRCLVETLARNDAPRHESRSTLSMPSTSVQNLNSAAPGRRRRWKPNSRAPSSRSSSRLAVPDEPAEHDSIPSAAGSDVADSADPFSITVEPPCGPPW